MKNVKPEVFQNLPPASQTGRFFIHSSILNRTFVVEPLDDHPDNLYQSWGDVNPATKKLETGSYGEKYVGGIKMKDSIITEENGFDPKDIKVLGVGVSPTGYVQMLEEEFLRKQREKGESNGEENR